MSGPRIKRQFAGAASDPAQRQITSFFSRAHASDSTCDTVSRSPALPLDVQAKLLQVGMRVRKSVPEGYKTVCHDERPVGAVPSIRSTAYTNTTSSAPAPRELVPFCGLHSIGGLAVQSMPPIAIPSSAFAISSTAHDFDLISGLDDGTPFSSQESVDSVSSEAVAMAHVANKNASRKRRLRGNSHDDDDEDASVDVPGVHGVWRSRQDWLNAEVSPRSLAPVGWDNARVMAVPRQRKNFGAAGSGTGLERLGQENMMLDGSDFDEAPFLDQRYRIEDMDVE
jgi:hypothetical protein